MNKYESLMWIDGEEVIAEVDYLYQPAEYEEGHLFIPESIEIQSITIYPPAWLEKKLVNEISMAREIEKREQRRID